MDYTAGDLVDADVAADRETYVRATALPAALVFAWIAVTVSPGLVRVITMWVHETGHAITAWFCGYPAFPGPWFTPITADRSWWFTLVLAGLLVAGGYRGWQRERTFWIFAAASALVLMWLGTFVLSVRSAQQLIAFNGDGGSLMLGTVMMLTLYARDAHPIRENHLRWVAIVIGALAFVDAFAIWTGPVDQLPFGENDNGLSDATVLTEQFGWTTPMLVARYHQLSHACLLVTAAVYVLHLWPARRSSYERLL